MNSSSAAKTILIWMVLILLALVVWRVFTPSGQAAKVADISYSELQAQASSGNIKEITIDISPNSYDVEGEYRDTGQHFHATIFKEAAQDLLKDLKEKGNIPKINVKEVSHNDWMTIIMGALPFVLIIGFWIFMMRQMQAGGNKAMSFGKSRARLLTAQQKKATFKDVAGIDEAKEELQ